MAAPVNENRKVFLYSCFQSTEKKERLDKKVRSLGGISKLMDDMYVPEVTHVIVPSEWYEKWTSIIMGAVGSASHIVYEDFIHESYTEKMFLPEEPYVPAEISNIMDGNKKFGKQLFKDQKAVVLMENRRKQIELRAMIEDAGATVFLKNTKELADAEDSELKKIDVIYTDLSILDDPFFMIFAAKQKKLEKGKSDKRYIPIRSYYNIFKLLSSYPTIKQTRDFKNTFDSKNLTLMNRLHPPQNRKTGPGKNGVYGKFLRRQNVVVLMENKHCQAELEGMVRDCGATSLKWDCKDLSMKKDEELERINVIYTDMSDTIMYDLDFLRFMNRNRDLRRPVAVKSFIRCIEIISTCTEEDEEVKCCYEPDGRNIKDSRKYDIDNTNFMKQLHPLGLRRSNTLLTDTVDGLEPLKPCVKGSLEPFNLTINCRNGRNTKSFQFHKSYLSKISTVFQDLFEFADDSQEDQFEISDFNISTVETFHKFLYEGVKSSELGYIKNENLNIDLMKFADKYDIQSLYRLCHYAVQDSLDQDNFFDVLTMAHLKNDEEFFKTILEFVENNPETSKTGEWRDFMTENPDIYQNLVQTQKHYVYLSESLEPISHKYSLRKPSRRPSEDHKSAVECKKSKKLTDFYKRKLFPRNETQLEEDENKPPPKKKRRSSKK